MKIQTHERKLKVCKIIYTLQDEGMRSGKASIFIFLSGSNIGSNDFESHKLMTLLEISKAISNFQSNWIVWTGGEPTLQLTSEVTRFFNNLNYSQAIETNGSNPIADFIDHTTLIPKVLPRVLKQNFKYVDEIKYPMQKVGQHPPSQYLLPDAGRYYLLPVLNGDANANWQVLTYCYQYVKDNPSWELTIQNHNWRTQ